MHICQDNRQKALIEPAAIPLRPRLSAQEREPQELREILPLLRRMLQRGRNTRLSAASPPGYQGAARFLERTYSIAAQAFQA